MGRKNTETKNWAGNPKSTLAITNVEKWAGKIPNENFGRKNIQRKTRRETLKVHAIAMSKNEQERYKNENFGRDKYQNEKFGGKP